MLFEFLIYLIVLIFSFSIGRFYNRIILKQRIAAYNFSSIEQVVINILVGVFLMVVITANIASGFTTTYFLFFLGILSPLYLLRGKQKLQIQNEFKFQKQHLLLLGSIPLFFLYHQLLFNRFLEATPFYDFLFLSKISSGLLVNGTESFYAASSAFYNTPIQPHLYHYFELWLTGLISKTFNYSEYQVLLYVTFPLLHLITFSLISIILESFFKKFFLAFCLAIGVLFGMKFYINSGGAFFELIETYRGLPYSLFYKLLSIYIFALLTYFFYIKKMFWMSSISVGALLIIYPTTVPSVFFLSLILFIYNYYKTRKISQFSIVIFSVIFYLVSFQKIMHFDTIANFSFHLYTVKQYVILFIESIIKIFLEHYLVIGLIFFLVFKNVRLLFNNKILLVVFLTLFGSIAYVYFNPPGIRDLNQVISNISPILLLILTIELIHYITNVKWLNFIVLITLIGSTYNVYINFYFPNIKLKGKEILHSNDFVLKIKEVTLKNSKDKFCSLSLLQPYEYYYHTSMKFNYLLKLKDVKTPLEIKVLFDTPKEIAKYKKMNKYYPPNNFFSKYSNSIININKYLKINDIKYVLFEKTNEKKAQEFLNKYCTLMFEDSNTQDALYKIN